MMAYRLVKLRRVLKDTGSFLKHEPEPKLRQAQCQRAF
jgi:hypothetical protein